MVPIIPPPLDLRFTRCVGLALAGTRFPHPWFPLCLPRHLLAVVCPLFSHEMVILPCWDKQKLRIGIKIFQNQPGAGHAVHAHLFPRYPFHEVNPPLARISRSRTCVPVTWPVVVILPLLVVPIVPEGMGLSPMFIPVVPDVPPHAARTTVRKKRQLMLKKRCFIYYWVVMKLMITLVAIVVLMIHTQTIGMGEIARDT